MTARTRPRLEVPGAAALLDELVPLAGNGGSAQLAATAERLATLAPQLDIAEALWTARREGRGVVVAGAREGPLLAVAVFPAQAPTPIHGHGGWGVAVGLSGRCDLTAFRIGPGGVASSLGVRRLLPGDATWWTRAYDVHRQSAVADEAVELVLLERNPDGAPRYEPPAVPAPGGLLERFRAAYGAGDLDTLAAVYAPDVLLDANVPKWRYQAAGRDAVLATLRADLAEVTDRRATWWHISPSHAGGVVELETRNTYHGKQVLVRDAHLLAVGREAVEQIVAHTMWCTGIWDADTVRQQAREAPMVLP